MLSDLVDANQAERVARTAQRFFDSTWPKGDDEMRRELRWASALHEVGLMVSHHDHHRHSAYIVSHVDAPGFSQSQQRRLGELVLGQRGGLRKIEAGLSREATAWQVLCLRLAVIECHARGEVDASGLTLSRVAGGARLTYTPQWAEEHPRTAYLLREEADQWARQGTLLLTLN